MRTYGRSRKPDLARSSGAVQLIFDESCVNPRATRRTFDRVARESSHAVVIDLRKIGAPSSVAWGAIATGVRALVRRGRDVTVYADAGLKRLLEISGFARNARVVLVKQAQAA